MDSKAKNNLKILKRAFLEAKSNFNRVFKRRQLTESKYEVFVFNQEGDVVGSRPRSMAKPKLLIYPSK